MAETNVFHNNRGSLAIGVFLIIVVGVLSFSLGILAVLDGSILFSSSGVNNAVASLESNEEFVQSIAGTLVSLAWAESENSIEFKKSLQAAALENDFNFDGQGNFFGKIRNWEEVSVMSGEGALEVRFENLFVQGESSNLKITRRFDLVITLDSASGNVLGVKKIYKGESTN